MVAAPPRLRLFCEAIGRRWRFMIESADGTLLLQASDVEPVRDSERLELLALVRGLEALDQPSRLTLVTSSLYVMRGLDFGLDEWRENEWRWERFGLMVPVNNADLWQRVDRALCIHQIDGNSPAETTRQYRIDSAHGSPARTPRWTLTGRRWWGRITTRENEDFQSIASREAVMV